MWLIQNDKDGLLGISTPYSLLSQSALKDDDNDNVMMIHFVHAMLIGR